MPSYVVLLRGINVGGNKKVAMADLRELLCRSGFDDVRTHLRSGNAVFRTVETPSAELAARIESAIVAKLAMTVRCVVLTRGELHAVLAEHPFADVADDPSRMMVLFLACEPAPELAAVFDPVALDPERTRRVGRVLYQWCPDGVLQAPDVAGFVLRRWKVVVTARNWNTVTRLAAMVED